MLMKTSGFPRSGSRRSEYEILTNAGQISHEVALALASKEYERFKKIQDKNYISDFDKEIKRITGKKDDDK